MEDALLDRGALDQLASDMGDNALAEVLHAALEELPELADRSLRAAEAGDLRGVAQACHALTSAAALVGATGLSRLAGGLEQAIKSDAAGDVGPAVARICSAAVAVAAGLRDEIGRRDANTV